jgi:LemA protein
MGKESFLILVFASFFSVIVGGVGVFIVMGIYKELIILRKRVKRSWSKIDLVLKQRQEALSELIQVTSKSVGHQQILIEKIRSLKSRFQKTKRLGAKIKISNEVTLALQSLFALVEAYPELKRNPEFLKIQKQFLNYQLQILKWSRTFNQHVEIYNSKVVEIPESLLAKIMGYRELDQVVVEELQNHLCKNNLNLAA